MANRSLSGSLELNNLDDYKAIKYESRKYPTYNLLIGDCGERLTMYSLQDIVLN